ncbi:unnamed protein product, partial [Nesidiocoris tenuis]
MSGSIAITNLAVKQKFIFKKFIVSSTRGEPLVVKLDRKWNKSHLPVSTRFQNHTFWIVSSYKPVEVRTTSLLLGLSVLLPRTTSVVVSGWTSLST